MCLLVGSQADNCTLGKTGFRKKNTPPLPPPYFLEAYIVSSRAGRGAEASPTITDLYRMRAPTEASSPSNDLLPNRIFCAHQPSTVLFGGVCIVGGSLSLRGVSVVVMRCAAM